MSKPHFDAVATFEIGATALNLADTTSVTLIDFPNDGMIRVPTRLELRRAAGDAYALSGERRSTRTVQNFQTTVDSYTSLFQGGPYLVVESKDDLGRDRPHIFVPLEGLLDNASEQKIIAFPRVDGHVFRSGATRFILRLTSTVASGTGSLFGRLYFDVYATVN